jgi:hypothetical protein
MKFLVLLLLLCSCKVCGDKTIFDLDRTYDKNDPYKELK